jgi:glycosyltransferase involved in cell wall biosynthesis
MGGAQRSMAKLSIVFAKSHHVWIVVFNNKEVAFPYGGNLVTLGVPIRPGLLGKALSFFQRVRRLKKLKKQFQITVSISFLEGADYINILSKYSEKTIISIRGSKRNDETMQGKFEFIRKNLLIPVLYRIADKIVTVNKGIAEELIHHFKLSKRKVVTIYNFYDSLELLLQASELKDIIWQNYYKYPILITSGRLAPEKGLIELLLIFSKVKERNSEVKLLILGDGPEFTKLFNLSLQIGLVASTEVSKVPDVLFLRNETNIFKYLHGATLYLMNSSSEGFPNGLAEAMICGLPVISADCPYGPREIMIPDSSPLTNLKTPKYTDVGVLMPRANNNNLAIRELWVQAISRLIEDNNLRQSYAKEAQARMRNFDKDKILAQWHEVIN